MALPDSFMVSPDLHTRQVKLPDGSEHTLHFRELPAFEFARFRQAQSSEDENVAAGAMAKLIAASLSEPDGKRAIAYEDALRLKPSAANALIGAILEVNGMAGSGND